MMRYSVPRKSRRVPLLADIHLKLEELPDPVTEEIQNLSLGGMSVGIQRPSAVGSLVAFEFKIGEALIEGTGEVVWNRDGSSGPEKGPAMGIRFRYLSPGSRERIFRLVQWYANQEGEVTPEAVAAAAASGLPAPSSRRGGGEEAGDAEAAGQGSLRAAAEAADLEASAASAPTPQPQVPAFQPEVPPPAGDAGPASWRSWPEAPAAVEPAAGGLPDLPLEPPLEPEDPSHRAVPAVRRPPPVQLAAYASSERWKGPVRWLFIAVVLAALIFAALRYGGPVLDWLTTLGEGGPTAMAAPREPVPPAARTPASRPASVPSPATVAPAAPPTDRAAVPPPAAAQASPPPAMDEITVVAAAAPEGPPPADRSTGEPTDRSTGEPAAATASLPAPREPAPAAPAAAPPAGSSPLRNVERISWQQAGGGTVVEIAGDGPLAARRYSSLRLEGEPPRLLIRIRGVERPYSPETIPAGSPELTAIRSALHLRPEGNELHVVLDLASPRVAVSRIEETTAGLRILLQLPS